MASVQSNSYEGRYIKLEVWEESFDAKNNTSVVGWKLSSVGGTSSRYYVADTTVIINGSQVYFYDAPYWTESVNAQYFPFPITKGEVSGQLTVSHDSDGKKTLSFSLSTKVYNSMTPETYSGIMALTNLGGGSSTGNAQASVITAASDGVLGSTCTVQWTPYSASFIYTVSFVVSEDGDTKVERMTVARPNTTNPYKCSIPLPYDLAKSIPNGTSRTLELTLTTYNSTTVDESKIVGNPSKMTINVTVPENENTRPQVTAATFQPSPDPFNGAFIQAKTGASLKNVTAAGKYNATIVSSYIRVEGVNYGSEQGNTSATIAQFGEVKVSVYAVDSRGFTSEAFDVVLTVAPYSKPKLKPVEGQNRVTAQRCDGDGTPNNKGAYLKIYAQRQYSPVVLNGVQHNFCKIQYRYKLDSDISWSSWVVILSENTSGDSVITAPLIGTLNADSTYQLEVQAVDTLGSAGGTVITVSSDKIYWHRDGARGSLGFGCIVSEDDVFLLGVNKTLKVLGGLVLSGDAAAVLLDLAHPVGSILETVSAINPNDDLGGTWVQMAGSEDTTRWRRTE